MANSEQRKALERIRLLAEEAIQAAAAPAEGYASPGLACLPVPYISQNGANNGKANKDSGAMAGSMLVSAYTAKPTSPAQFLSRIGEGASKLLSPQQVKSGLASFNLLADIVNSATVETVYRHLAAARPLILLLRHQALREAGFTLETAEQPLYVVAVGFDVENLYVHDPLRQDDSGQAMRLPLLVFHDAWSRVTRVAQFDRIAIVPQQPLRRHMIATAPLNVHSAATPHSPKTGQLAEGTLFTATQFTAGWGCIGEDRWVNLSFARDI